MATYTQLYYHIVFSTKKREPAFVGERREGLFRYIWGIVNNTKAHLYRINGVDDHIHLLTSIHPSVPLADFVKDIKVASSQWIGKERVFPRFSHWQDGYGAFTCSHNDKDAVIEYIKSQQEHHRKRTFAEELKEMLNAAGVVYDKRFLD